MRSIRAYIFAALVALLGAGGANAQDITNPSLPGGSTTQLQYNNAGTFGGISGWTTNGTLALTGGASTTLAVGGQITNAYGTITTSQPFTLTQTWNASGVSFNSFLINVTDTASATASMLMDLQVGGTSAFKVGKPTSANSTVVINGGISLVGASQGHLVVTSANTAQTIFAVQNSSVASSNANWEFGVGGSASSVGAGVFYFYNIGRDKIPLILNGQGPSAGFGDIRTTTNLTAAVQILGTLGFTSASGSAFDASISRSAAGVVQIGTTAANALGSLMAVAGTFTGTVTSANLTATALANVASTSAVCYNTGTGVLTYNATVGTCTVSGAQFKNLGEVVAASQAQIGIDALRVMDWSYKPEYKLDDRPHVGLIADDVEKMDPRCVTYKDGQIQNYDDRCVLAYLVAVVQQQKREIGELKRR